VHPRVTTLQYWTLPSSQGGIWCCHVSSGSGSYLPAREGFGVTTCLMASDPASTLGRAPVPPRVQWLQILPPCSGGLRCCRVSHGSGPRLIARESSSVATCPMALDPTSPLGRALVPPCVPQLWTPPPRLGGLRCRYVSCSSIPRLPDREGSGAAMCPTALSKL
jgi:hypothetical protein